MLDTASSRAEFIDIAARLSAEKSHPIEGFPVLIIREAWQKDVLSNSQDVAVATTISELESAIKEAAVSAIFIPIDCFGSQLLSDILARQSLTKTLFMEASNG